MKQNDKILKLMAKISLNSAKKACGTASWLDCYQPKEPIKLIERLNKKKNKDG